ncbi:MAG: hypothetical protein PVF07_00185 [Thiogranum sp.]|jgi:hypothetical protein
MRRIGFFTAVTLTLVLAGGPAVSDTLLVDSVKSDAGVARPDRGMTMDGVLARYGEPKQRSGPVGDPPISTWDYGDFVVYFENQYVIHSVVAHK